MHTYDIHLLTPRRQQGRELVGKERARSRLRTTTREYTPQVRVQMSRKGEVEGRGPNERPTSSIGLFVKSLTGEACCRDQASSYHRDQTRLHNFPLDSYAPPFNHKT